MKQNKLVKWLKTNESFLNFTEKFLYWFPLCTSILFILFYVL
jgi:hypothetical protein